MRLKFPSSMQIGGHTIKVRFSAEDCEKDGEHLYGYFSSEHMEIVIHPELRGSILRDTFMHEAIEAANHLFDLDLNHQTIQTLGLAMEQVMHACLKAGDE